MRVTAAAWVLVIVACGTRTESAVTPKPGAQPLVAAAPPPAPPDAKAERIVPGNYGGRGIFRARVSGMTTFAIPLACSTAGPGHITHRADCLDVMTPRQPIDLDGDRLLVGGHDRAGSCGGNFPAVRLVGKPPRSQERLWFAWPDANAIGLRKLDRSAQPAVTAAKRKQLESITRGSLRRVAGTFVVLQSYREDLDQDGKDEELYAVALDGIASPDPIAKKLPGQGALLFATGGGAPRVVVASVLYRYTVLATMDVDGDGRRELLLEHAGAGFSLTVHTIVDHWLEIVGGSDC